MDPECRSDPDHRCPHLARGIRLLTSEGEDNAAFDARAPTADDRLPARRRCARGDPAGAAGRVRLTPSSSPSRRRARRADRPLLRRRRSPPRRGDRVGACPALRRRASCRCPDPSIATTFAWPLRSANIGYFAHYATSAFVDQNTAVGPFQDWNCGARSYDQHRGTDIFTWPYGWLSMDLSRLRGRSPPPPGRSWCAPTATPTAAAPRAAATPI